MKRSFQRVDRFSVLIKRNLSEIIRQEPHPTWGSLLLTITEVKVSPDLHCARVYFTVFDKDVKEVAKYLQSISSSLRVKLAKTILLRRMPTLQFFHDNSIEYEQKLLKRIAEANPKEL